MLLIGHSLKFDPRPQLVCELETMRADEVWDGRLLIGAKNEYLPDDRATTEQLAERSTGGVAGWLFSGLKKSLKPILKGITTTIATTFRPESDQAKG